MPFEKSSLASIQLSLVGLTFMWKYGTTDERVETSHCIGKIGNKFLVVFWNLRHYCVLAKSHNGLLVRLCTYIECCNIERSSLVYYAGWNKKLNQVKSKSRSYLLWSINVTTMSIQYVILNIEWDVCKTFPKL